jgi:alkylation response protein AidB-like acyl-CoA dehydrogenase
MILDSDHEALRAEARTLADEFGPEYFRDAYRNREYPATLYDRALEQGWVGAAVPESAGGPGMDHLAQAVILEGLGRYGYDFAIPMITTATVLETLVDHGTDDQLDRFVRRALDGDCRFSVGVTEPHSGSDAAGLRTRAKREGDEYVVTGTKTYQSGAGREDNYVHLYVRTDPDGGRHDGISAVLVPITAEGVTAEELPLITRKAAGTYDLDFEGVRVPVANRVGEEGGGWAMLMDHLIGEHTYMAAAMVGTAQTVVDTAVEAASDRERFGSRVADFQTINHRLADMQTEVDAARLLTYRSAAAMDENGGSRTHTSKAKLKAGEVLQRVAQDGMQILGGAGLDPANDMERYWREGASATVAGGTSEIQRSIVARGLVDGQASDRTGGR